jgi:hypothetical protein
METACVLTLLLIELSTAIGGYIYWRKKQNELPLAQNECFQCIRDQYRSGALEQLLSDMRECKIPCFKKRKQLPIMLRAVGSTLVGLAILFTLVKLVNPHVVIRTIVAILVMLPSMWYIAIAIAEEADKNRILAFEDSTREQVLNWAEEGKLDTEISSLMR